MSKPEEKPEKTFMQTLPGIITSLAALITAFGGCIAVIFGIPAISNAVFGVTPTPTISQLTSSVADIPTLTQVPIPTNSSKATLSMRLPTLQEINSEIPSNIWDVNSIQIQDMPTPGIQVYSGNVQKNSEYLFPMYWCAKSLNILDGNLQSISMEFFVNNEPIPNEYILSYFKELNTGWQCKYYSVILSGWDNNIQYTLEVRRVVLKSISDGNAQYTTGTYTRKIIIDVH